MGVEDVKLQSPAYDGSTGNGEQLPLPAHRGRHTGQGLAEVLAWFAGKNVDIDLGKLKEGITVDGAFTALTASQSPVQFQGPAYSSALSMFMAARRTRRAWPQEEPVDANWGSAGLPADEQDAGTLRGAGTCRLIYDVEDPDNTGSLARFFLYGFVQTWQLRRVSPTQRVRILYNVSFVPASIVVSIGGG